MKRCAVSFDERRHPVARLERPGLAHHEGTDHQPFLWIRDDGAGRGSSRQRGVEAEAGGETELPDTARSVGLDDLHVDTGLAQHRLAEPGDGSSPGVDLVGCLDEGAIGLRVCTVGQVHRHPAREPVEPALRRDPRIEATSHRVEQPLLVAELGAKQSQPAAEEPLAIDAIAARVDGGQVLQVARRRGAGLDLFEDRCAAAVRAGQHDPQPQIARGGLRSRAVRRRWRNERVE